MVYEHRTQLPVKMRARYVTQAEAAYCPELATPLCDTKRAVELQLVHFASLRSITETLAVYLHPLHSGSTAVVLNEWVISGFGKVSATQYSRSSDHRDSFFFLSSGQFALLWPRE